MVWTNLTFFSPYNLPFQQYVSNNSCMYWFFPAVSETDTPKLALIRSSLAANIFKAVKSAKRKTLGLWNQAVLFALLLSATLSDATRRQPSLPNPEERQHQFIVSNFSHGNLELSIITQNSPNNEQGKTKIILIGAYSQWAKTCEWWDHGYLSCSL